MNTVIRRSLQVMGGLLLALLLLVAAFAGIVVVANWTDAPLSPAAQAALTYTPPTEAQLADNGYLILMGLDAPDATDTVAAAVALGRERLTREIERRRWVEAHGDDAQGMPPTIDTVRTDAAGEKLYPTALRCPKAQSTCTPWHVQHRASIEPLLRQQAWLLTRLSAASHAKQFSNPAPAYLMQTLHPFGLTMRGQELWLAQAALALADGHIERAMASTQEAVQLRARLTASSNNLITSMIALAMHYRELRWLSELSAALPPSTPAAVQQRIDPWLQPPIPPLGDALEGEKTFMASIYFSLTRGAVDPGLLGEGGFWKIPLSKIARWGYLPQESLNEAVHRLTSVSAILTQAPTQWDPALQQLEQADNDDEACTAPWKHPRNLVGRCLAQVGATPYRSYAQRIADVDGYRRMVLLQRLATAEQVPLAAMPQWLARSPEALRNPYTLQPMLWDAATQSMVLEGREKQTQHPDASPTYRVRFAP